MHTSVNFAGPKPRTRYSLILFLLTLMSSNAFAQIDTWLGGTGNWSNASLWSGGVPTSTSSVLMDNGNPAHSSVTINYNGALCGSLTVDGDDSLVMVDGANSAPGKISSGSAFMLHESSANSFQNALSELSSFSYRTAVTWRSKAREHTK